MAVIVAEVGVFVVTLPKSSVDMQLTTALLTEPTGQAYPPDRECSPMEDSQLRRGNLETDSATVRRSSSLTIALSHESNAIPVACPCAEILGRFRTARNWLEVNTHRIDCVEPPKHRISWVGWGRRPPREGLTVLRTIFYDARSCGNILHKRP